MNSSEFIHGPCKIWVDKKSIRTAVIYYPALLILSEHVPAMTPYIVLSMMITEEPLPQIPSLEILGPKLKSIIVRHLNNHATEIKYIQENSA